MARAQRRPEQATPAASRPYMPGYGIAKDNKGLLPWSWARERLTKAHTYWIATTRPDGAPHAMPVWGIWLEEKFWFSTGLKSRKGRNLAANPKCVICAQVGGHAVIVEGSAAEVTDPVQRKAFSQAYQAKYDWNMEDFKEPFFSVSPRTVFAFSEVTDEFSTTATRWVFNPS